MLNLWKSCVLPHFLIYLRYISNASQLQALQASLNRSLSTTLHVYGHPTALLAETGIPPLYITQNLQLAQLRFRLHSSPQISRKRKTRPSETATPTAAEKCDRCNILPSTEPQPPNHLPSFSVGSASTLQNSHKTISLI